MRFPELIRALLCALALGSPWTCLAGPEEARADLEARIKRQLPEVAAQDYALGSAAFDAELRASMPPGQAAASSTVEAGKALWNRKFGDGRALASCFPNGGRRVAGTYPQYDPRLKKVVTLEMAVNQCLKVHGEPLYDAADSDTMGAVMAYLRSLSDGQKMAVRVPAAAEPRFEEGRRLYFTRLGQRNYACASCHVQAAGRRYDDVPLSVPIGQATHWPVTREGRAITLQMRIRECLEVMGAAPFAAGSDELNHLEYFLAYLSNGLPLKANVWRPDKKALKPGA